MINIENMHPKLETGIQFMLFNTHFWNDNLNQSTNLAYYGEFNLNINFIQNDEIDTCGVNVSSKGMNFYYSSKFLDRLSQKEVNFVIIHENFHLLFDHPQRSNSGGYDHKLANVAQDMIINHLIVEGIPSSFVEIPKDDSGKNMALFIPKEYNGSLIFEELYSWLKNEMDEWEKNENSEGLGNDSNSSDDNSSNSGEYGHFGKSPNAKEKYIETWSKEKIFQDIKNEKSGEYLDSHLKDEVSEDYKKSIIKDIKDKLENRGLLSRDIEDILGKLYKKRKDFLSSIKKTINGEIIGYKKEKTISRPNRKGILGLKGSRKKGTIINCILDTSGSMSGKFDEILSYLYQNSLKINMIQTDYDLKNVTVLKSKKELQNIKIKGFGGTRLMPAVNLISEKYNKYNTVILTDGYCDNLDLSKLNGKVLILTEGIEVNINKTNKKVKQIKIEKSSS